MHRNDAFSAVVAETSFERRTFVWAGLRPARDSYWRGKIIVAPLLNNKGRDVFSITPDASVTDAALYLRDKGIGAALVLDQGGAAQPVCSLDAL